MKKTSDELKLIDLALADETWETCHARLRNEGLAALRSAKRSRSRRDLVGQLSALVVVFAAVWWGLMPRNPISSGSSLPRELQRQECTALASSHDTTHYITEEQMLAMFPKGSCVLAEVNGQKELVLLDGGSGRERFSAPRRNGR